MLGRERERAVTDGPVPEVSVFFSKLLFLCFVFRFLPFLVCIFSLGTSFLRSFDGLLLVVKRGYNTYRLKSLASDDKIFFPEIRYYLNINPYTRYRQEIWISIFPS